MPKTSDASRYTIELEGKQFPVIIRKHKTSRRMVLRYQPLHHVVSLTLPRYASIRQGLRFVEEKREWIAHEIKEHAGHVSFEDGAQIPVLGKVYTLRHIGGRGTVRIEGDMLLVSGEAQFMARRVRDWLKAQAQQAIETLAIAKAKELGLSISRISVRDTSSHWGSCSHAGRLSFSWRLILAPKDVLEYVVCHEVAHLKELNHSTAFWNIVAELCPHWRTSRQWLKREGSVLYQYG